MFERKKMEKKNLIILLTSLISGVVIFTRGLKFLVFGFFTLFNNPLSALLLISIGLSGIAIIIGALLIWKSKKIIGGSLVFVFSLFSILKGFSIFILIGAFGGVLALTGKLRDLDGKKLIGIILIFSLSSTVFLSGLIHYRQLSSEYKRIEIDGRARKYLIKIPSSYSDDENFPLVLVLHGGGGSARTMKEKSNFDRVSEEENFIVVYPDGTGRNNYFLHAWNSGYISGYANKNEIDDVSFLNQLIEDLKQKYNIDGEKIFMTGHSNGAKMTYRFGAEYSKKLSGIAPVSGSIGGREDKNAPLYIIPEPTEPLSVIHIHGKKDEYVPYNGGKGKSILGARYDLSAEESVMFWVKNNNCSKTPQIEKSENNLIELKKYKDSKENTKVSLITINKAGHFWKEMNNQVKSTNNHENSLAKLIWTLLNSS